MVILSEDDASTLDSLPQEQEEEIKEHPLGPLLESLENYTPTMPDALTLYLLNQAGLEDVDPGIVRIVSVAAQKFISDIANDALVHCKTRTSNQHSHSAGSKDKKLNKDRKYTLTVEDLTPALADHGICVRKPQYFV